MKIATIKALKCIYYTLIISSIFFYSKTGLKCLSCLFVVICFDLLWEASTLLAFSWEENSNFSLFISGLPSLFWFY